MHVRVQEEQTFYLIENTKTTHQSHDKFFRTAMSDKRVARDFIKSYLPQDIAEIIDLDNLELHKRSFLNDIKKEAIVDVLFKTSIAEKYAFIYLLVEHQSKPDELMPFRLLKYIVNIMDDHISRTRQKKLPLVYPMVVYHAERSYPYSTNILDIIDAPRLLSERYFLKPFHLIDLGTIEDEKIKSHSWSGIMEFALKHVFARDVLPWVKEIAGLMQNVALQDGEKYVETVLEYLFQRAETNKRNEFVSLISKEVSIEMGEKVMTIAEQYRQEGRQEGWQEGVQDGVEKEKAIIAKRLLAENLDLNFIAKVTQLSIQQLKQLT